MLTSEPAWRTPVVVGLCEQMRKTQDFAALPILADALEEAGYDDATMLKHMRRGHEHMKDNRADKCRMVALVYSTQSARAVKWLDDWVESVLGDFYDVVEGLVSGEGASFGTDEGADVMRYDGGETSRDDVWAAVEQITGITLDKDRRDEVPYSCAC